MSDVEVFLLVHLDSNCRRHTDIRKPTEHSYTDSVWSSRSLDTFFLLRRKLSFCLIVENVICSVKTKIKI